MFSRISIEFVLPPTAIVNKKEKMMEIYRVSGQEVVALPVILESCLYDKKPPSNIIRKHRPSDLTIEKCKQSFTCISRKNQSLSLEVQ
jgi:hypothetical protein